MPRRHPTTSTRRVRLSTLTDRAPTRAARRGRVRAGLLLGAAVLTAGACNPSTTRPPFLPFRGAIVDTMLVAPSTAIRRIHERLRADSAGIRTFSERDGYIETTPIAFDAAPEGETPVTIRWWADPATGNRTRVTVEPVYRWTPDPSRERRDRERLVSANHPSRVFVRQILVSSRRTDGG